MKRHYLVFFILCHFYAAFAQPSDWQGRMVIRDGVTYIYNSEEGLWDRDKTKKMQVEKIFSLGSLEAREEYIFSWVQDLKTDRDGNIYVCDSQEHRIQIYDRNGKYLKTIGRKGKGPGELMRPMAVTLDDIGNIYVLDVLNYRVSIFKSNGQFYKSCQYKGFAVEYIEIFDKEGFFLKSFPWDWQQNGMMLHVDNEGYFYSNFGETEIVPGVTKWKITFE